MNHVAWSCDGKKIAAVGIDKITRVWQPEKGVREVLFCFFAFAEGGPVDGSSLSDDVLWRALG